MPEYIVDCEHVPYDGRVLVLPISISSHVHERVVRCGDCLHYRGGACRLIRVSASPDFFCGMGWPRDGDGDGHTA